mgnify:FL=1
MVDATRYVVSQTVTEVIELIREDRARLLARVEELIQDDSRTSTPAARLTVVNIEKDSED